MIMQKKNFIFLIGASLALSVILLGIIYISFYYIKYQERLAVRHHLLCEVLKPGMAEAEVLIILRQAGEFTTNRREWGGGAIELTINFKDIYGIDPYGRPFEISFFDYKYKRAYERDFDYSDPICGDFPYHPA